MTHGTAGDLGLFGNLSPLTNGVTVRVKINGKYGTFTNWKTNADIKDDMFDVEFDSRAGGQGNFGTSGRGSFNKTGSVLRLDAATNDRFEVYVQDTLTGQGLSTWTLKVQGHPE